MKISALCQSMIFELVQQKTLLTLHRHQLQQLDKAIQDTCSQFGMTNCDTLYQQLILLDPRSPLWEFLIARITVGESYFMRDREQMAFLKNVWLPQRIASRRTNEVPYLRFWSAGSSAGQEAYSLAFLLHEVLPDIDDWQIEIVGSDINSQFLSIAQRGEFTRWSMRSISEQEQRRYFDINSTGGYSVKEKYRRNVSFCYGNLRDNDYLHFVEGKPLFDLIMCRNVLIYFDRQYSQHVMQQFSKCIHEDGIILMGPSDPVDETVPGLLRHSDETLGVWWYSRSEFPAQVPIHDSEEIDIPLGFMDAKQSIIELIRNEQWQDVIEAVNSWLVENGNVAEFLQFRLKAEANLALLDAAEETAVQCIQLDPLDHHALYILSSVYFEQGRHKEAEETLAKVITLRGGFFEAYYRLAHLSFAQSKFVTGVRYLHQLMALTDNLDPQRAVHNSTITVETLRRIVSNEIQLYQARVEAGGSA